MRVCLPAQITDLTKPLPKDASASESQMMAMSMVGNVFIAYGSETQMSPYGTSELPHCK